MSRKGTKSRRSHAELSSFWPHALTRIPVFLGQGGIRNKRTLSSSCSGGAYGSRASALSNRCMAEVGLFCAMTSPESASIESGSMNCDDRLHCLVVSHPTPLPVCTFGRLIASGIDDPPSLQFRLDLLRRLLGPQRLSPIVLASQRVVNAIAQVE